jgi:hypothetical protein
MTSIHCRLSLAKKDRKVKEATKKFPNVLIKQLSNNIRIKKTTRKKVVVADVLKHTRPELQCST